MNSLFLLETSSFRKSLAIVLTLAVLSWAVGLPTFISRANAASLTSVSDTLSTSAPTVVATSTVAFTTVNTITAGQTIKITFDPTTSLFLLAGVASSTITFTGATYVTSAGSCSAAASEVYPNTISNTASDRSVTFEVCPSDTISVGAKVVTIPGITNPAVGSYVVRINGTMTDAADTRVAIVNTVLVTASVDTSLTFTISPVAIGTTVNGDATTTATTSTATAIKFGTLVPGTPQIIAQGLAVSTNARNGFVVTVHADQALTSSTGAVIDPFKDGASTITPTAWTSPTNILDNQVTYGHEGVTSDDADEGAAEFASDKFAGNFTATSSPRAVFSHTGPADGTTQNKGFAKVAYKVEITALQEAGTDYTQTLTYVATPTF